MARPRTAMDEMESAVIDKHAQRAWEAKGNRATVTDVRDGWRRIRRIGRPGCTSCW